MVLLFSCSAIYFCKFLLQFLLEVAILLLEAILLSPFMCVFIAIIVINLAVTLWQVDSEAALTCSGYELESCLEGQLKKAVYTRWGFGM